MTQCLTHITNPSSIAKHGAGVHPSTGNIPHFTTIMHTGTPPFEDFADPYATRDLPTPFADQNATHMGRIFAYKMLLGAN